MAEFIPLMHIFYHFLPLQWTSPRFTAPPRRGYQGCGNSTAQMGKEHTDMGVSINGTSPKWLFFLRENLIMDDVGAVARTPFLGGNISAFSFGDFWGA